MAANDSRAQAAAEFSIGDAKTILGRYSEATDRYASALRLARRAGWVDAQAAILGNLGNVCIDLGNLRQAAVHHADALDLYRQSGSRSGEANSLINLGEMHHALGRLDEATRHLTDGLTLHREVGNRYGEAYGLNAAAAVAGTRATFGHGLELAQDGLRASWQLPGPDSHRQATTSL